MKEEFELVAKTFHGLEEVLAKELTELGASDIEIGNRMVAFTGDKAMMYKANFCLRTAIRILKPIKHFKANNADEVYENIKSIEWENYLDTTKSFSVDSVVFSNEFRHSKFVAYKVKDAIVDYFRDKTGERPSVRISNPDVLLNIHIAEDRCTLSLDSSGESLHRRGYRQEAVEAPLNEVLAAGMILMTGWKGECDLIDPMCGSGTIPIEAALIARNIAPGVFRKEFAFEKWVDFDQELFDSIYNVCKNNGKKDIQGVDVYYTMKEAKHYRTSKYESDNIKFPLVFKMFQVTDDQWIGKITVDMLMKLRQAQLLNYNVNAQRTLTRVVKGDKESYKITLNQKAVNEIQNSFENNEFIPNTITLNIPMETEYDFYYDESSCSLIINSLEHLDISDGFHRYISACQLRDINPDFDYPMELRILNYTEDKAKQFIYQEDKKTFMKKIDSRSMNMNRAANIVVTRVNENIRCNLKGMINRNDGLIHFGELADLVDYFYFKGITKEKERSVSMQAIKELTDNFNFLTEYDEKYLEQKMSYRTLLVVMFCFDYFNDKDKTEMCNVIEKVSVTVENSDNKKFANKTPRKNLMSEIEEIVKGAM